MLILHLFRKKRETLARIEEIGSGRSGRGLGADEACNIISSILRRKPVNAPTEIQLALPAFDEGGKMKMLASTAPCGPATAMANFRCSAVRLEPDETVDVLLAVQNGKKLAAGLFASPVCTAFAHLLSIAASLVSRGRMLPSLEPATGDGPPISIWLPVPSPEDAKLVSEIATRLPPCSRATGDGGDTARELLEELTDVLTRRCCATLLSEAQANKRHFYSAHDAWFASLRSKSGIVHWRKTDEISELASDLKKWRDPAVRQPAPGCTLHFSLIAPACAEGSWRLEIGRLTPDGLQRFETREPERKAWLLALGQSAQLFPPVAAAKGVDGSLCAELTRDGAWAYLSAGRKTLEDAGFAAAEPDGIRKCEIGISAEVIDDAQENEARALDAEVRVKWKITLDGEELTAEESTALLTEDLALIFFRGAWMTIDRDALREAIRATAKNAPEILSARELIGLSLGVERYRGVPVQRIQAGAWLGEIISRFDRKTDIDGQEQPPDFNGELRPYQKRGFAWMKFLAGCGFGGCLADDMGLGKTAQALALLLDRKRSGVARRPALIAAPVSILGNWMRECATFAPALKVHLHYGAKRLKNEDFISAAYGCDIVLTGYPTLVRDFGFVRRLRWSALILDEAQNIKNPDTRQAGAARAIDADMRIALTGTPMENHVGELWSIMDFLNPGILGSRETFHDRFFKPIHLSGDEESREKLRIVTAPFLLRRLKTDKSIIADLPEKIENKTYCALTAEQATLYRSVTEDLKMELREGGSRRTGAVFAAITHLKQICNHPAAYLKERDASPSRSGKLLRLVDMLEECFDAGESALVFTQFAQSVKLIRNALRSHFGCEMPILHGAMTRNEREGAVDRFQNGDRPQAFILSLRAGGTGLNLTRAANVFHFDRWWNPAVENQATDRAFRIGQRSNVMVHKFICSGTLEEKIDRLLQSKNQLSQSIIASGEKAFGGLSDAEIMKLLALEGEEATLEEGAERE